MLAPRASRLQIMQHMRNSRECLNIVATTVATKKGHQIRRESPGGEVGRRHCDQETGRPMLAPWPGSSRTSVNGHGCGVTGRSCGSIENQGVGRVGFGGRESSATAAPVHSHDSFPLQSQPCQPCWLRMLFDLVFCF